MALTTNSRTAFGDLDAIYRDRIGANARLWRIGDAGHIRGYSVHPGEYRRRALGFFAAALS